MLQKRKYIVRAFNTAQLASAIEALSKAKEVSSVFLEDEGYGGYIYVFNKYPYEPRCEEFYLLNNDMDEATMKAIIAFGGMYSTPGEPYTDEEDETCEGGVINWSRVR